MGEIAFIRNDIGSSLSRVVENTEREARLIQAIIDASGSNIVVIDEERSIVYANRAWRQFAVRTGSPHDECGVGEIYPDLSSAIAPACSKDAAALRHGIRQIICGEEIEFEMRYRCTAVSGPMWISLHAAAFLRSGSHGRRLILINHDDVSAAEVASAGIRKDEQRFRRLLETTNIVPWERNVGESRFSYVGEQVSDLLGYTTEQWKQENFWASRIHPEDRSRVLAEYSNILPFKDHFKSEYRMLAEDGSVVWIEDLVDVVREWSKTPTMHGFMTNISERKHAQSVSADLSRRLINAQEDERKRIARELHDDLNQRVALIAIELEQGAQMRKKNPAALSNRLLSIKQKVSEISNEIHRMSYELHPSKLDHLGLVPALRSFCSELSRSRGIKIHFRCGNIRETLNRDITLCIFRTAQEALQNASKYSGAAEVVVSLTSSGKRLELIVSDEGCGFTLTQEKLTQGLGLTSMQERVRHVGGTFKVLSERSQGTVVHVTVPIDPASSSTSTDS